ncbi:hypothetical protein L596_009745 [Steinernema carpocapsae]|uniref:Uncharacterized protein n=1 Tax=Steinernema carpocapsae TaxID=34508 RepID=A0A4U5PG91_STECR|nr:hypothetical protein L596_009745 [Steinernema carpocapsae]
MLRRRTDDASLGASSSFCGLLVTSRAPSLVGAPTTRRSSPPPLPTPLFVFPTERRATLPPTRFDIATN